jgi:hypothetical protein
MMARKWASATVLKAVFYLCFIVLFFQMLGFAEWVFASTLTWHSPIAHLVPYFMVLLVAQTAGLIFYFRMPWVGVVAAWISVAVILLRAIPWGTSAWASTLQQFRMELIFLVLMHVGFAAFVMGKRATAEEIAEVVGTVAGPTDTQS